MKTQTEKLRFLVVDDDLSFRTRLVRALEAREFAACDAGSGDNALESARRTRPHRAVVDLRMPGMSGLELVRQLIHLDPEIQVVVLTGYGSIATAVEAVRLGAIDYLQKPADTDQILQAFDRDEAAAAPENSPTLARVEWEHIHRVLSDCQGNISEAARRLGLHRRSLQRKLAKLPPME